MHLPGWVALAAAGLVLVPGLVAALDPITVNAQTKEAGLQVQVTTSDRAVSAYVVVHHDDPVLGPVVDRIVPVEIPKDGAVNVSLEQLRDDVNMTLDVIPTDALAGLVDNASNLLNLSRLPILPSFGSLDLGKLLPSALPLDLYAYPYLANEASMRHPRVLMTPSGVLGVAYLATRFDDGAIAQPYVRLSVDGGHRFQDPVLLDEPGLITSPTQGSNDGVFEGVVAPSGGFVFVTGHDDGNRVLQNWSVTKFDPVTKSRSTRVTEMPAGGLFFNYSPLVFADGSVLIVNHGPLNDQGNRSGPGVLRFGPDGTYAGGINLEATNGSYMSSDEVWARAGPQGQAAVVWRTSAATWPSHNEADFTKGLRYAETFDRGLTWTPSRALQEIPAANGMEVSTAMDELGILHVVANAHWSPGSSSLYYARIEPGKAPVATNLTLPTGPIALASWNYVAAAGGRAWILGGAATEIIQGANPNTFAARYDTWAWESLPRPFGLQEARQFKVTQSDFAFEGRPALMADGRMVVPGGSSSGRAIVPTFDPFPEPACAAKRVDRTSTPTPASGVTVAPETCGDHFTFRSVPGLVQIQTTQAHVESPGGGFTPSIPGVSHEVAAGSAAVAGTAVLVGLAFTDAARYGAGLLGARLFARVQGKKVLQHAIRGGLHDHIQANPGIRFNRLRKDLGLSHGTTAYHLRVLQRNGLVRQRKSWTTRHYYPLTGAAPAASVDAHDVILEFLRRNPGAGSAEVARNLGLSRQLAHYHLRRLAAGGRLSMPGQSGRKVP